MKKTGKTKKIEGKITEKELDRELDSIEKEFGTGEEDFKSNIQLKMSKPISEIKKGDRIRVDGKELVVDAHYVLIDHGTTKEMAIELYDPKAENKDYQLRYFDDQVETTIDFYELQGEIMFVKKPAKKVEW
ncbi:MAG: hypothetical protein QXD13_01730 [Candidatus Pacearchaeota archaeon]